MLPSIPTKNLRLALPPRILSAPDSALKRFSAVDWLAAYPESTFTPLTSKFSPGNIASKPMRAASSFTGLSEPTTTFGIFWL